jgi:hypothetical protein
VAHCRSVEGSSRAGWASGYLARAESGWSRLNTPSDMHKGLHYSTSCQMFGMSVSSNGVSVYPRKSGVACIAYFPVLALYITSRVTLCDSNSQTPRMGIDRYGHAYIVCSRLTVWEARNRKALLASCGATNFNAYKHSLYSWFSPLSQPNHREYGYDSASSHLALLAHSFSNSQEPKMH